jgi:hypothetical protein
MTLEQFEMEYRSLAAGWLAMSAAAKRAALTKLGILESAVDNFERRMPRRYCRRWRHCVWTYRVRLVTGPP